jgi:hypothetical protein
VNLCQLNPRRTINTLAGFSVWFFHGKHSEKRSGGETELILRDGMPFDLNRSPRVDRPLFDEMWRLADELKWC